MQLPMHTHMQLHLRIHLHTYTCTYTYTCVYMYIYIYTRQHVKLLLNSTHNETHPHRPTRPIRAARGRRLTRARPRGRSPLCECVYIYICIYIYILFLTNIRTITHILFLECLYSHTITHTNPCVYIYSTCIDITIYTFIIYILTLIDTIRRRRTSTQLCMLLINQEARVNP